MFALPDVVPYKLARAPLVQALVQVRFPVLAHLGTISGVAGLQDKLRGKLPYMEASSSALAVQVGPSGAVFEPGPQDGWQLSDDAGHRLVLAPGSVNLVVGDAYRGINEFSEILSFSLEALAAIENIARCDRIGVRYASIVTPPDGVSWRSWFRPEIVGLAGSDVIKATVEASANRVQFSGAVEGVFEEFPKAPQGIVTSGWFPKGAWLSGLPPIPVSEPSFVLDFDFFVDASQPFNPSGLVDQFQALHGEMDKFFRWSLTQAGADYFGLEEEEV